MTNHHGPTAAPANVAELVDNDLVAAGLADYLEQTDLLVFDLLMDGQLSWTLEGCDALGVATVDVIAKATGERVATAKVHWTLICRPG